MIDVSVIVTTKNEEINIANCLESIKRQNYPQDKIEIIVVDNNSTDRTKEIAKKYTDKVYNFGPERSAQRNFGVKQAIGKYILYLDADMILSEDVISECVEKCEQGDYIALYTPERIVSISSENLNNLCNLNFNLCNQPFWIKVRDFERSFYNATVIDCVRFICRDKFLETGGFDEDLTGPEDWDFDRRIKQVGKIGIINSPIYHNEEEFNLKKYIKKKSYYARSFNKYIQKWGKDDPVVKKQLGACYRILGIFIKNNKEWKKLFMHPFLSTGMFFLRFLVGLNFLMGHKKVWHSDSRKNGILIISPFFRPNIGGVETHLDDLCEYLRSHGYNVYVITYQPLTTRAIGERIEKKENLEIHRIRWIGYDLFHKLESYPLLEVLYITPLLLIASFWFLLLHRNDIRAIHVHGLNAALIARIIKFFFYKKAILSIHAIYHFKDKPLISQFLKWIIKGIDIVMPLAERSKQDILSIGVPEEKVRIYTQWVNYNLFNPKNKEICRKKLNIQDKFVVLFVGRLLEKKGVPLLLEVARELPEIKFIFIGDGPMYRKIKLSEGHLRNVKAVGRKTQEETALYYGAADIVVIPSQYEEGFARVVLEALFSGRPLIAANKGCLPEMLNSDVSIIIEPTIENITNAILFFLNNPEKLQQFSNNARPYALSRFTEKNAEEIIATYN